jgi:hypothetical protein
MLIFQAPVNVVPQTFMQLIVPYLVTFISLVVPALAVWIVNQLKTNHDVAVQAATAAGNAATAVAAHSVSASAQLSNIQEKVDGAMSALTAKSNQQTADALADKDKQIAALTQKINPNV